MMSSTYEAVLEVAATAERRDQAERRRLEAEGEQRQSVRVMAAAHDGHLAPKLGQPVRDSNMSADANSGAHMSGSASTPGMPIVPAMS